MKLYHIIIVCFIVFGFKGLGASVVNGGLGLPHTKAAYTTQPGHLTTFGNLRFWTKRKTFSYEHLGIETGGTIWVVQGVWNLTYGVYDHIALSLTPILYQDTHKDQGDEIPWDTFFNAKFGHFKIEKLPVWIGLDIGFRLPTGKQHNILFEDYTAGQFEYGFGALLTYRYATLDLVDDIRVHANFGYWNYNDNGQILLEDQEDPRGFVSGNTQSFKYALGMELPTQLFTYGLECYGLAWITQPPVGGVGRENYLYLNVSFAYTSHKRFRYFLSADLRLSEAKNETEGLKFSFPDLPSKPGWRINLGMRYAILPPTIYKLRHSSLMRESVVSQL